jgi:hypothetical protein
MLKQALKSPYAPLVALVFASDMPNVENFSEIVKLLADEQNRYELILVWLVLSWINSQTAVAPQSKPKSKEGSSDE